MATDQGGPIFSACNDDDRELVVTDTGDSIVAGIFGPGKMTTRYEVALTDDEVAELQLALAAYLHRKRHRDV